MSVSTNGGVMVGLYYENITDTGFEKADLDELIDFGTVAAGSYAYDSSPEENVIGFWVIDPSDVTKVEMEKFNRDIETYTAKFIKLFGIKPSVYVSLCIY